MERLNIKFLILILLLPGCQIVEVSNNESVELIPDLSVPKNVEIVEVNQIIEIANIHSKGRVISFLEGGYDLQALSESIIEHLKGLKAHI